MIKLIVIGLILSYVTNIGGKGIHHDEICGGFDGRRLYLELGEHGTLVGSKANGSGTESLIKEIRHCSLEIVTCPSCIISIQFK